MQEVEHTGFNKMGTYTVRHIVMESSSGMVLAISDYVDLDCRRPSLTVNLQVDTGSIRTKLQYGSVVGRCAPKRRCFPSRLVEGRFCVLIPKNA